MIAIRQHKKPSENCYYESHISSLDLILQIVTMDSLPAAQQLPEQHQLVERIESCTRIYHQTILSLLAQSSDETSNDPEQLLSPHLTGHVAQHILHALQYPARDEDEANCNIIRYLCRECGAILHPGWKGTTLRVQGSSSSLNKNQRHTLRRRRQRKRWQQALTQQKQASKKPSLGSKNQHNLLDTTANQIRMVVLESAPKLSVLLDRHSLVITCGSCQTKVRLPGLKRPRKAVSQPQCQLSAKVPVRKKANSSLSEQQNPECGTATTPIPSDLEFVPLPPKVVEATEAPLLNLRSNPATLIQQRLQQQSKGKTKKKKATDKKSKLLEFLSKLND